MKTYRIKKNNEVIQSCIPEEIAMLQFLDILNQGEDVKTTWHDINNPSPFECRGDRYQITEEEKENVKKIIITLSQKNGVENSEIEIKGKMTVNELLGALETVKYQTLIHYSSQVSDNLNAELSCNIENKLNHDANI